MISLNSFTTIWYQHTFSGSSVDDRSAYMTSGWTGLSSADIFG
jgi:hypothetical protein